MTLLHRIETAEAGSRELSDEVLLVVGWDSYEAAAMRGDMWHTGSAWTDPEGNGYPFDRLPCPTTNLQDAVDLVPDGWLGNICFGNIADDPDKDRAELWNGQYAPNFKEVKGEAATPALALCAAILRSKGVE